MREFAEEILRRPDLNERRGALVDFERESPFRELGMARRVGRVRPYMLDIGFDPVSLKAGIRLVCVFEEDAYQGIFRGMLPGSDERSRALLAGPRRRRAAAWDTFRRGDRAHLPQGPGDHRGRAPVHRPDLGAPREAWHDFITRNWNLAPDSRRKHRHRVSSTLHTRPCLRLVPTRFCLKHPWGADNAISRIAMAARPWRIVDPGIGVRRM